MGGNNVSSRPQHSGHALFGFETYHGVNQTLVAVAQVCSQPSRGFGQGLGRPLAVGEVDGRERLVFLGGVLEPVQERN